MSAAWPRRREKPGCTSAAEGEVVHVTTRRQLLLGAAGLALSGCQGGTPSRAPGFESGFFPSAAMKRRVGWALSRPAPGPLPLFLVLHGRGGNHDTAFDDLHLDHALATAVRAGVPPFALASVDGGEDSYYHPRRSGISPLRMIFEELFPVLEARGIRTHRFAVGGWSMGGFGALVIAELLGPTRVAAVAIDSPALFLSAGTTAHGAFDDAEDFRKHDVLRYTSRLHGVPLRVTCGTSDPFLPGVRRLLEQVPTAARDLRPGGHDDAFWRGSAPKQLAFVGRHLDTT
jgi:enterochelin esterase-like enzyme